MSKRNTEPVEGGSAAYVAWLALIVIVLGLFVLFGAGQ
jgi:hypothetical protein